MIFTFSQTILPEWIDENSHMRDAYFGLIFSMAGEAMQFEIGFDRAYRQSTGCTLYLLEDHKFFLREVLVGTQVRVETVVLDHDEKRFLLHLSMFRDADPVATCEFMELHVNTVPKPKAAAIPADIQDRLQAACLSEDDAAQLRQRSRGIALKRQR